jgi:hypothetical protein
VEKFKYKDANKALHKMAISLRSIASGELGHGPANGGDVIMKRAEHWGIVHGG